MTSTPDLSPLIGAQMTRLCLDYAVTLLLAAYDAAGEQWLDATMKIEAPFTVSAHDSRT